MAGLLYKDFAAVKGKAYVIGILLIMGAMILCRLTLPAEETDIAVWAASLLVTALLLCPMIGKLEISIIFADEGKKQKQYFLSLPLSPQQYVASKYVFVLIAFYSLLSVSMMLQSICLIGCEDRMVQELAPAFQSVLPVLFCMALLVPAVELPFFIGFGTKAGGRIKTGLLVAVFFLIIVFLLFGDLTIFDRINFISILHYLDRHTGVVLCANVLAPYVSLLLYYLSYRIACRLFAGKGWENDQ